MISQTQTGSHLTQSPSRFYTPEVYLRKLENISNDENWPFTKSIFRSAREATPHIKLLSPSEVIIPVPSFLDTANMTGPQCTLEALWDIMPLPNGIYKKSRHAVRNIHAVKLAPDIEYIPGIRWVLIDTAAYNGISATTLWDSDGSKYLGGSEILTLAILQDDWIDCWDGAEYHFQCLSAYIYDDPFDPLHRSVMAMCLCRGDDTGRLHIGLVSPDLGIDGWSSSTVGKW